MNTKQNSNKTYQRRPHCLLTKETEEISQPPMFSLSLSLHVEANHWPTQIKRNRGGTPRVLKVEKIRYHCTWALLEETLGWYRIAYSSLTGIPGVTKDAALHCLSYAWSIQRSWNPREKCVLRFPITSRILPPKLHSMIVGVELERRLFTGLAIF